MFTYFTRSVSVKMLFHNVLIVAARFWHGKKENEENTENHEKIPV